MSGTAAVSEKALEEREGAGTPARSELRRILRSLLRRKPAFLGVIALALVFGTALFSPWVSPYDPQRHYYAEMHMPPLTYLPKSGRFALMGTDHLGRDVLSRIIYAGRVSLVVAFATVVISGIIGVCIGIVSAYRGGWLDSLCMRLVDIALAFPFILLALAVVAALKPSLAVVIVVISLRTWVIYARVVRGATLSLKEKEFVVAAVAQGLGGARIVLRHILPNVLPPAIVIATLYVGRMIIIESSLSFLGLGVPAATPTWGSIVGDGRAHLTTAWWISFFPGLAIMVTVLGGNLLGDWLRDYLDPRLRD